MSDGLPGTVRGPIARASQIGVMWFRQDLRLHDNPALTAACAHAELLAVVCEPPSDLVATRWGFPRVGRHRQAFRRAAIADLSAHWQRGGRGLHHLREEPVPALLRLAAELGDCVIHAEDLPAPEERRQVQALREAGLTVQLHAGATLVAQTQLPAPVERLPQVFTPFRQAIEKAGRPALAPLPVPAALGAPVGSSTAPEMDRWSDRWMDRETDSRTDPQTGGGDPRAEPAALTGDERSAFPHHQPAFAGAESAALAHWRRYLTSPHLPAYKRTRDGLIGTDYSSKLSPWLATGALSVRLVAQDLREREAGCGPDEGGHWLWVELLWRDYFRWLMVQHGRRLFLPRGLQPAQLAPLPHDAAAFARWCQGCTGHDLVDAGMRELAATGYLSNRIRQIVASYLLHELGGDWRAGAAWFESQLLDFDVHSNQGNWLYIAGLGTDPRGGRRFDPDKQAAVHDPDGRYRALWLSPAVTPAATFP